MEQKKLNVHHSEPVNSSLVGKTYIINLWDKEELIDQERVEINSNEEFNSLLEKVKQFNTETENIEIGRSKTISYGK